MIDVKVTRETIPKPKEKVTVLMEMDEETAVMLMSLLYMTDQTHGDLGRVFNDIFRHLEQSGIMVSQLMIGDINNGEKIHINNY